MTVRLSCNDLSGGHGSSTAFRHVDLEVHGGQIVALLGPNGAGKTTLLLTIAGLLPTKEGEITVEGEVLRSGRPALANRAGIVLVPDNRSLFTNMTVEENLKVAARRDAATPKDMVDVFPRLGRLWHLRAGALSGGEQQMLAMARALIQRPKVLLADELSLGLAPLVVKDLFVAVRHITVEFGCAVVLVEQHVHLALGIADHAIVLNHGSVVLRESAERLRHDPAVLEQAYLGEIDDAAGVSSR